MHKRLLALDIRASRFGFAVFEGPTRLLDWGVRSFGEQGEKLKSTVSDRIATLLAFHRPFAVVVRLRKYHSAAHHKRLTTVLSSTRAEIGRHPTKCFAITTHRVKKCFAMTHQVTKHDIATWLANQFEELSWRLPTRRQSFQSEAPIMAVFDAVANGIAFFSTHTRSNPRVSPASCLPLRWPLTDE